MPVNQRNPLKSVPTVPEQLAAARKRREEREKVAREILSKPRRRR